MSIYDNLPPQNPAQFIQQLRANPAAVLQQRGFNIPAGMTNPQQIVQHLLTSGQVPQARYLQALNALRK